MKIKIEEYLREISDSKYLHIRGLVIPEDSKEVLSRYIGRYYVDTFDQIVEVDFPYGGGIVIMKAEVLT